MSSISIDFNGRRYSFNKGCPPDNKKEYGVIGFENGNIIVGYAEIGEKLDKTNCIGWNLNKEFISAIKKEIG